ncbi:hypothetical protein SODALDRAFT_326163 [Sodiomyces alkalinus F11]|uniref:Hemerythrin-like domain-containing protein n=1 Tax=Sodiomyces alkalinus (strain CBS 110278 / VKM F-3762 / F11) TaxID=1314773 RepID=A0A3N2Q5M4_SODAK|nr:hypothetical protein SODALDRAFT_326163 [Sodiomyces alkalinus F11]ROT41997.1 hypothetical protein SODALDRAFT_326163 [Sodiomyces alkalinus F11]
MVRLSDKVAEDHREMEKCFNEITSSSDHDHQERFGNQFTWELARHSIAEELVVYPAFEKYMGNKGHEMAEEDRKAHHEAKEKLKKFQNMSPEDANYVPMLKQLWGTLSKHIEEEESHDLPALEAALEPGASETMSQSFERTKMFVPTRSHPSAGESPPFETAMGLLTAPMDRIADMFRKFPQDV